MSKAAKETLETLETLGRAAHRGGFPHPDPVDLITGAKELRKAAAKLQREAEKQCNGIPYYDPAARQVLARWTDADEEKSEAAKAKARAAALDALRLVFGYHLPGLEVEFQADPRGAMVKVWPEGERDRGSPLATF